MPRDHRHNPDPNPNAARIVGEATDTAEDTPADRWVAQVEASPYRSAPRNMRWKWPTFRLRSLLFFIAVCATLIWVATFLVWRAEIHTLWKSGWAIRQVDGRLEVSARRDTRFSTPADFQALVDVQGLDSLNLANVNVSASDAQSLSSLSNLRSLNLYCAELEDGVLPHLAKLQRLETLDLSYSDLWSCDTSLFTSLPNLHSLRLHGAIIGREAFENLGRCKTLRQLDLSHAHFDHRHIGPLSELQQLEELNTIGDGRLSSLPLTPQVVEHIAAIKSLRIWHAEQPGELKLPLIEQLRKKRPNLKIEFHNVGCVRATAKP